MRVDHVINVFPGVHSRIGGGEHAALRVVRGLNEEGGGQRVLTLKFDKGRKNPHPFPIEEVSVLEDFLPFIGRYVEVLKWYVFQFDPLVYFQVLSKLKKDRPEVVNIHNMYKLTFSVLAAAKKLGIPVCLTIYDYWYFCPLSILLDDNNKMCRRFHGAHCAECLPRLLRPVQGFLLSFRKSLFDKYLGMVDRFIVLSESSRRILADYGIPPGKIEKIPVIIPEEFSQKKSGSPDSGTASAVLFMGWIQKRKGLHVLLDAMDEVWKQCPGAKLRIIAQEVKWEKEYNKQQLKRVKGIDAGKCELVVGHVPRRDIEKAIADAAVIVIPEQWENMSPLLVIEAMYLSKAIVASGIGGIPEFVEQKTTGMLAKYDDPKDFAEKICYILKNPRDARRMGVNAREKILKIQADSSPLDKLKELYSKL
ncbi:MAG: glycosyltransferase family 4 protein [Endomicrobiales bacterium]|nr:glycosyltransferase family 4 protein [Endomicrobiales bacterium]